MADADIITKKTDGNIEVVRASNYVRQPPKKFEDPSASQQMEDTLTFKRNDKLVNVIHNEGQYHLYEP